MSKEADFWDNSERNEREDEQGAALPPRTRPDRPARKQSTWGNTNTV